ncbi:hypothetical protein [Devosia sp. Leaf64]|jgi:DNA-binding SARP family transcriptional activator/tetratricopeptide (TPR) repeat protein|uniref:hypothetical protein n=1 Tax=Devosia sp. Leaf64 TaxID=1736229 RepID=UPI000714B6A5|nr:hypothetical protein [Devosia sp. Leaf64]KQN75204.1 hypothetical protein ASE94_02485 [Devosia sp. Leaf64]
MPTARLNLLGEPTLFSEDGIHLSNFPKKAFALAAFLVRSPQARASKRELADFLWPLSAAGQGPRNLRQLLFRVRQFELSAGVQVLNAEGDTIKLDEMVSTDLLLLKEGKWASAAKAKNLLSLYQGPFLQGFPTLGDPVGQWVLQHRRAIEDEFVETLLAAVSEASSELRQSSLSRGIEVAPTSVSLRRELMTDLIKQGKLPEARRILRDIQLVDGHKNFPTPRELAPISAVPNTPTPIDTTPLPQAGRDHAGVPHLIILPPKPMTEAIAEQFMAEALVDDVTIALTRLRSVSILAPHTARQIIIGDVAGQSAMLRADYVVTTKLVGIGAKYAANRAKFSLMLEKASTGDMIWAESIVLNHDTGPIQFAAIANGIALSLVDAIERSKLRSFQASAKPDAYIHYLNGQRDLQILDLPSVRRARNSFKEALALSPNFAPAHAGFSQSLIYEWVMRGRGDIDVLSRARAAAERARDVDPLFGGAHQMLGRASLFAGDFSTSLEHFSEAEALNPHHADMLCDFADTLMHSSLDKRANSTIELAIELNPLAPDAYWWASAGIKFFVGDYNEALQHLEKVKNREPVLRLTAACAAMAGQDSLANLARTRFLETDPGFKLDDWISVLPVRDASHRRHYRDALRKAGFK